MATNHADLGRSSAANAASSPAPLTSPAGTLDCDDVSPISGGSTAVVALCRSVPMTCLPTSLAPTSASAAARDLWAHALQGLSAGERAKLLDGLNSAPSVAASSRGPAGSQTMPGLLEQLRHVAERKRAECDEKRWRFELNGRTYILRDVASKVIEWVNLFKQVGDVAVQYDPGHAALPWAGVRFLLEVCSSESIGPPLMYCLKLTSRQSGDDC